MKQMTMKYFFSCALFISFFNSYSQTPGDPKPFAASITPADLKKHLTIIASDSMEGRETAMEGQKKAARYIEEQFRQIGLQPGWNSGYQQNFPVFRDSIENIALEIEGKTMRPYADFTVIQHSAIDTSFSVDDILYVGRGSDDSIYSDYKNANARGRVILVTPEWKRDGKRKQRKYFVPDLEDIQLAAQKNGAVAILVADRNFPRKASSAPGPMYVTKREHLPHVFLISDSLTRLIMGNRYNRSQKRLKKGSFTPVTFNSRCKVQLSIKTKHLESSNVIGVLPGTDKAAEALIISAHYDHVGKEDSVIFYGADDDGSGTVAVLEIAEAFKKAASGGSGPRRSIVFLAVSGEEKGLWGSSFFAENSSFPLDSVSADLNIDMIGRIEEKRSGDSMNYVYVVGDDKLSSELRHINEKMNNTYVGLNLDYKFNDPADPMRIYYRSDHYNFARNGVPVIFYFNGIHKDYHRPTDTEDKINYELLMKRSQLIFHTAWEMANRDNLLKRDRPLVNGTE